MAISIRQNLSLKLALIGLITTLSIGLSAGLTQIYFDYHDRKQSFDDDINKIMSSSAEAATRAIFTLDDLVASAVVQGIHSSYPYIIETAIIDDLGQILKIQKYTPAEEDFGPFKFFNEDRVFELTLSHETLQIKGELRLVVSMDLAYRDFYDRIIYVLGSAILQSLVVFLTMFFIFKALATNPLREIIEEVGLVRLGRPGKENLIAPNHSRRDEIGRLLNTINHFTSTADHLLEERDNANTDLKNSFMETRGLVDRLPQIVFITNDHQRLLMANKTFQQFVGADEIEIINKGYDRLLTWMSRNEYHSLFDMDDRVIRSDSAKFFQDVILHDALGRQHSFEIRKYPIIFQKTPCCLTVAVDTTELKARAEQIHHLAYHDPLTDLPNRTLLLDRLNQTILRSRRHGTFSALMFVDLDNFKAINDSLGHATGDEYLKHVADVMKTMVRDIDTVARIGGDEFVLCLGDLATDKEATHERALVRANNLREMVTRPFILPNGQKIVVTASIGIIIFPDEEITPSELLKYADTAMYYAKNKGKDTQVIFEKHMAESAIKRLELENDLRDATEQYQFIMLYQPQVDTQTNRLIGAEALIRWDHPVRGMVSPVEFIPVLESSSLIIKVGQWILKDCCEQLSRWIQQGLWQDHMKLGINVSAVQFNQPSFVEDVKNIITESGVPAHCVDLEVTESLVIGNIDEIIKKMHELKEFGCYFSIDDFGTGYSSLSYLKSLPLDVIKIDRSFIIDVLVDESDQKLVSTIIGMAESLNLKTIAEGVETPEQLEFLSNRNCMRYQGYLFSPPVTTERFEHFLQDDLDK
jgi:diguanylate cyclase (GGDEF)-like protein